MGFAQSVGLRPSCSMSCSSHREETPLGSASSPRTTLRAGAHWAASSPPARLSCAATDHSPAATSLPGPQPARTKMGFRLPLQGRPPPSPTGRGCGGSGRSRWGHSIAGNSHPQTASQSSGGDRWADHFRGHWPGWGAWGEEGHSGKPGAGAWSRSPLQLPTGPSPCGSHAVLELGGSPPPPVREEEDAVVLAEQELNY